VVLALLLAAVADPGPCRASLHVLEAGAGKVLVAVRLDPDPGWHTYWRNAGDTGSPTTVRWSLPEGWSAGPVQWPTPERIDSDGTVSYGYEGPVDLVVELKTPDGEVTGATLRARVDWLVCKDVCISGSADLSAVAKANGDGKRHGAMPVAIEGLMAEATTDGKWVTVRATAPWEWPPAAKDAVFFPEEPNVLDHSGPQTIEVRGRLLTARLPVSPYAIGPVETLRAVLALPEGAAWPGGEPALLIDLPVTASELMSHQR
jgi:hypothetical protein